MCPIGFPAGKRSGVGLAFATRPAASSSGECQILNSATTCCERFRIGARCIRWARSRGSPDRRYPAKHPSRRAGASRSRLCNRKSCCGGFQLPGSRNRCSDRKKPGLLTAWLLPGLPSPPPSSQLEVLSFSCELPLSVFLTQLDTPDKGFIPLQRRLTKL